jgi:hypothetical protein
VRTSLLFAIVVALLGMGSAIAQAGPAEYPGEAMTFLQAAPPPPHPPGHIMFFHAEMADGGKTVTGAPYTATAVTESSQTLADGNHISNKATATVARDSQGRTRREEVMGSMGPWSVQGPHLTFIHDPVANSDTILDAQDRSARVLKPGKAGPMGPHGDNVMYRHGGMAHVGMAVDGAAKPAESKTEDLGTQTIEGVAATGKRVTRSIPAGAIGNERPLETVSEVWYSPDLQVVLMSKHSDPRFGETTYRLTNIKRGEPERSLFAVPSGYSIRQGPPAPPAPPPPAPPSAPMK